MSSGNDFISSWILESPRRISPGDSYDYVSAEIQDALKRFKATQISDFLFKIIATDLFYWYEKNDIIQLGAIVERRHDSLAIKSVGKNPNLKGHPPWASDLYVAIMKDTDKNLRLTSDSVQTDQGHAIWKKLIELGHKISVFDADKPGKTFKTFDSASELDAFFKDNDFKAENFRYILSETADHRDKVHADFRHRRYRELSGI